MTSYIELHSIKKGQYNLEIIIPAGLFFPTKDFQTCLGFDLNIEYFKKSGSSYGGYHSDTNDVINVVPPQMLALWKDDERVISVNFDKPFTIDDWAKEVPDQ